MGNVPGGVEDGGQLNSKWLAGEWLLGLVSRLDGEV